MPAFAAPALADPPTRSDGDFSYVVEHSPGPDACDFPLQESVGARVESKVFTGKDGTVVKEILTFPGAYQEWTNLDTGERLRLAWSGPGSTRSTQDGTISIGTGSYSWRTDPRLPLGEGELGFWVTMGRHTYDEATGDDRIAGRVVDVCQRLSP